MREENGPPFGTLMWVAECSNSLREGVQERMQVCKKYVQCKHVEFNMAVEYPRHILLQAIGKMNSELMREVWASGIDVTVINI